MKKLVSICALALCLALGVAAFAACGGGEFDPEKPITIVGRESTSGTRTAFMELIGLKGKDDPSGIIQQSSTAGIMAEVKGNPQAIGYESLGFVTDDVKKLKIDNVEASVANIKAGTYKISRPLSVLYFDETLDNALFKAFHDFLLSADAQTIINAEGYVSTKTGAAAYAKNAPNTGTIKITGSTSLQPLMEKLVEKFKSYHSGVTIELGGGGSGTGRSNAKDKVAHFGMISDDYSSADQAALLKCSEVAKDGIAVVVHKSNTLDSITMAQLKKIYDAEASPRFGSWAEVIG